MLIPEFLFIRWVFRSLVSVSSLVFWSNCSRVLVAGKFSGSIVSPLHSGKPLGFGCQLASVVPSTCVASGVTGTCLVSELPSRAWPLVQQKLSAEVVGQNMESREGGTVWGCGPALGSMSWLYIVSCLGSLGPAWPLVR